MGKDKTLPHFLRKVWCSSAYVPLDRLRGSCTGSDVVIMECMSPLTAAFAKAYDVKSALKSFVDSTLGVVQLCDGLRAVVLVFDWGRPDMKDVESATRAKNNNNPSMQGAAMLEYRNERPRVMLQLLDYLINTAVVLPGVTVFLSGLVPACKQSPTTDPLLGDLLLLGSVPLALTTRRDTGAREINLAWTVLPENMQLPRTASDWFRTTTEADDGVKFWLTVFVCGTYKLEQKPRHYNVTLVSIDSDILLEALLVYEHLLTQLTGKHKLSPRQLGTFHFVHRRHLYNQYIANTATVNTHESAHVFAPDVINMSKLLASFVEPLEEYTKRCGVGPVFLLLFGYFFRPHDYSTKVAFYGISGPDVFCAMVRYALENPTAPPIFQLLAKPGPDGVGPFDTCGVSIDYMRFRAAVMGACSAEQRAQPTEAMLRAHCARQSIWLAKALCNHVPGWRLPLASETFVTTTGQSCPRYGYAVNAVTGICEPCIALDNDDRAFYACPAVGV